MNQSTKKSFCTCASLCFKKCRSNFHNCLCGLLLPCKSLHDSKHYTDCDCLKIASFINFCQYDQEHICNCFERVCLYLNEPKMYQHLTSLKCLSNKHVCICKFITSEPTKSIFTCEKSSDDSHCTCSNMQEFDKNCEIHFLLNT